MTFVLVVVIGSAIMAWLGAGINLAKKDLSLTAGRLVDAILWTVSAIILLSR